MGSCPRECNGEDGLVSLVDYTVGEEAKQMATVKGVRYGCSVKQDSKGWYAYTHRARSKSYPARDKIPTKVLKFISSTG